MKPPVERKPLCWKIKKMVGDQNERRCAVVVPKRANKFKNIEKLLMKWNWWNLLMIFKYFERS